MGGTLVVNGQEKMLTQANYVYLVSVWPSLGLNTTFVGGDYGGSSDLMPSGTAEQRFGKFYVSRETEPLAPTQLIVFASARNGPAGETAQGYFQIKSPYWQSHRWSETFSEKDAAADYGFVHPRYHDRAVAAMCDGHVELLTNDQLQDMRRWSNQAAEADAPKWTLTRQ